MRHRARFLAIAIAALAAFPLAATVAPVSAQQAPDDRQSEIEQLRRRLDALERGQSSQAPPAAPSPPRTPSETASNEEVVRALERSLVEQGGQLLPFKTFELVPELQYLHSATVNQLAIVPPNTITAVTTRQDLVELGVIGRAGLPWDSQINLHIPFIYNANDVTALGTTATTTNTGLGDIDLTLQKQVLYEHGWVPDGIFAITWKTTTGRATLSPATFNGVTATNGTGTGFDEVAGSLTLTKRQDPLVFLAGASYAHVFDATQGGVLFSPGDQIEARLGTLLAASPDTSLRFIFDTTFVERGAVGGVTIAGSDQVVSFVEIGVSSLISASTLVDAAIDIGLTRQTPDFRFILSVPIRF